MANLTAPQIEDLDIETLLGLVEVLASQKADGHITVMRFTTEWKATLGTPNLDTGEGREEVANLKSYSSLRKALVGLLVNQERL